MMFLKKIVKGVDNKTSAVVPYQAADTPATTEDYLAAKDWFERNGFERNVSRSSDGYGDLGTPPLLHYAPNGVVHKKIKGKVTRP